MDPTKRQRKRKTTPKRDRVLAYIRAYFEENGKSPTYREIKNTLNLSVSTVHYHVWSLVDDEIIEVNKFKTRAIKIIQS